MDSLISVLSRRYIEFCNVNIASIVEEIANRITSAILSSELLAPCRHYLTLSNNLRPKRGQPVLTIHGLWLN
ncbi:hypothetical protein QR680_010318 [Steinernema hermaphroditum]|uniref:Uncharacterized protein n=1 Tax=Steinernema hermaphroditum TaxID=289476 RepID=A0AA39IPZ6_9BILA|nr:hypothetical protein QR680_010318 [Steinernema hermaphroditum]